MLLWIPWKLISSSQWEKRKSCSDIISKIPFQRNAKNYTGYQFSYYWLSRTKSFGIISLSLLRWHYIVTVAALGLSKCQHSNKPMPSISSTIKWPRRVQSNEMTFTSSASYPSLRLYVRSCWMSSENCSRNSGYNLRTSTKPVKFANASSTSSYSVNIF